MLTPRHQMRIRTQRMRLLDEQAHRTRQLPAGQPLSCLPAPVVPVALWHSMLWCLAVQPQRWLWLRALRSRSLATRTSWQPIAKRKPAARHRRWSSTALRHCVETAWPLCAAWKPCDSQTLRA